MASPQTTPHKIDDISDRVWIGTIVTVVLATIAVCLRFLSRHIAKAGYWWDDWVIVSSVIFNWGMAVTQWIQILEFNFGKHGEDISRADVVGYQKSFVAIQLIYFTNALLTKTSLLLLYQRIFGIVKSFHRALLFSWFLIIAFFIACVIASIAGCSPVSYVWDRFQPLEDGESVITGSCFKETAFFRWNGIANMLLDVLMLVLPLPMVWRLRTSKRVKVLLTGVFLMGGFVCIVSLLRIVSFNYPDRDDRDDPTYTRIHPSTWSSVEQGIGIVCACLPTFRPLRQLWHPKTGTGSCGSNKSNSRGSSGRSSKRSSCQSQTGSGPGSGSGVAGPGADDLELGVERVGESGGVGERRWADEMADPVGIYGDPALLRSLDDVLERGGGSWSKGGGDEDEKYMHPVNS